MVVQDPLGRDPPAVAGEVGVYDRQLTEGEPVPGQRRGDPGEPVGHCGQPRCAGRDGDPPVAERQQVFGEGAPAGLIVGQHGVGAEGVPADDRDAAAGALERGELGARLGLHARVVVAGPGDDDDAHPLGDQVAQLAQLVLRVAAGVRDLDQQPFVGGHLDDAPGVSEKYGSSI